MRVLVVEDDRYYGQLVSECLQDAGLDVDSVPNVEAALSSDTTLYSAFVIDLMLPNDPVQTGVSIEESRGGYLSGVALARRIRQKDPNARIVLLTGMMDPAADQWAESQSIPLVHKTDGEKALLGALERLGVIENAPTPRAFIVHGRDEETLSAIKDYIRNGLGWQEPVVLREQPSLGKTIIEKFEDYAGRVDCVFVLLTPDDIAPHYVDNDSKRRSRQNVILELGFFYAQFGRKSGRVFLLHKGPVEIPSDLHGIIWIDISDGIGAADQAIRKEVAWLSAKAR